MVTISLISSCLLRRKSLIISSTELILYSLLNSLTTKETNSLEASLLDELLSDDLLDLFSKAVLALNSILSVRS